MKVYGFQCKLPNSNIYGESISLPDNLTEKELKEELDRWVLSKVDASMYFQYDEE